MEEIWKDIEGYEGLYQVSNMGRVKSLKRTVKGAYNSTRIISEKILSQQKFRDGYLGIKLCQNGGYKRKSVHRLVATAFIKNRSNLPYINHKNGIKTDNKVENLEWCSPSYNVQHAWNTGLNIMNKKRVKNNIDNGLKNAKSVIQYDIEGNIIREFYSLHEAERLTRIRFDHISRCCKKKQKTAGGYVWRYKEE